MTTNSQDSGKGSKIEAPMDCIAASQPLWGEFRSILRESIGLKSDLIQDTILRVALKDLAETLGENPNAWLQNLKSDPAVRHKFCEHFTVGESWFFRDWTPFACLRQFAQEFRIRHGSTRLLRILSIPCSTGQEPWSMAMLMAWMGWSPDQVVIDALDLNQVSLAAMKTRVYRNYSRRESNPEANMMLDQYSTPLNDGFLVDAQLAKYVRIHHGNILDSNLDPTGCGANYDVIFSRNLFIYLDLPSRAKAMANLLKLLDQEGILYFGHAEGSVIEGHGLVPWNAGFTFAFTRARETPVVNEPKPPRPARAPVAGSPGLFSNNPFPGKPLPDPNSNRSKPVNASKVAVSKKEEKAPVRSVTGKSPEPNPLDRAQSEADAGNLDTAAELYAAILKSEPMNGKLWRMAATVEQARGKTDEATRMYDRALYIDPKDTESLRMLSLIRRQRGDIARAEQLERRLASIGLSNPKNSNSNPANPEIKGGNRK